MNTQNKGKTLVITDHVAAMVTINGRKRICRPHPDGYRCRLKHKDVRALGIEPESGRNYFLTAGQYVVEMGTNRHWPIAALPELRPGALIPADETWIEPLPRPVREAKPRNYAGRAPRGLSERYRPLVEAAQALAPLLPDEHPLRRALARLDAMRAKEAATRAATRTTTQASVGEAQPAEDPCE